jgi:hypothetical protein
VPFLSSAVLGTVALLRAGETETLAALANGAVTAALVMPLSTAPSDPVTGVSIGTNGLTGRVSSIVGANAADVLVVPVAGPDGLELHTVSRAAGGVDVSPVLALDMTRPLADVQFSGAGSRHPEVTARSIAARSAAVGMVRWASRIAIRARVPAASPRARRAASQ